MFVRDNSVRSARMYFTDRLKDRFSANELRLMFQEALMQRLQLSRNEVLFSDQLKLSESDLLYVRSLVKRLLEEEPFQYIIGYTEFYGLKIACDRRALIPRPETEELVDWIVKDHGGCNEIHILDLCTGTGCIALALQSALPQAQVRALDVSEEALQLARENAQRNQLTPEFFRLDVLKEPVPGNGTDTIWVSNPPYIPTADQSHMHRNVLDYEPHLALFVEDSDPLLFYRIIARQAQGGLTEGGNLYLEIHERLGNEVVLLLEAHGFHTIELREDLQGRQRMVKATLG